MEPKKNPKHDVHRQRGLIFNLSLVLSLGVVITAFKWGLPYQDHGGYHHPIEDTDVIELAHVTYHTPEEKQAKPKPVNPVVLNPREFIPVENDRILLDEPESTPADDVDAVAAVDPIHIDPIVPEKPDSIFVIVEKMPEPVGGYAKFYKVLNKNMKYPAQARRTGTKGRVFVEFTVQENGELNDIRVIKGIGVGCDEEAMRVIALTKWNAGKQRGRPVKVKMVQPIIFDLKN